MLVILFFCGAAADQAKKNRPQEDRRMTPCGKKESEL